MNVIIDQVSKYVPSAALRVRIYQPIVDAFNAQDWDTHAESIGTDAAFDEVIREAVPKTFDDEDNEDDESDEDFDDDLDDVEDEEDLEDDDDDEDEEED